MLHVINTMTMTPPITPVGPETMAQAAIQTDVHMDIQDLCLVKDRPGALSDFFCDLRTRRHQDLGLPEAQLLLPQTSEMEGLDA